MNDDGVRNATSASSPGRVDYDRIADTYDCRYEHSPMQDVSDVLRSHARRLGARDVLEVGCGTARYLADLPSERMRRWGLDLSAGMLEQAERRGVDLRLVRARAVPVPFADGTFDLVFCVNAIHHFDNPCAFVEEAHRCLRPGGVLVVIGSDPRDGQGASYIYQYFEGTLETDLRRFPSWGTVLNWMVRTGFGPIEFRWVEHIDDPKVGAEVLDDPFLRKNACSQLALLSDAAYSAGLRRIESALQQAAAAGERLIFPADIHIGALAAKRTGQLSEART